MNFNSQDFSICYSRLGDSMESLGRDCFFVKIVEMLGCFGDFEVQQECRGGSRPDRRKALCRRLQDEWQDKLKMQKTPVIVLYIS